MNNNNNAKAYTPEQIATLEYKAFMLDLIVLAAQKEPNYFTKQDWKKINHSISLHMEEEHK